MSKLIRKISVGKDYKENAMHYAVGQEVYGGHTICDIIEEKDKYSIYIRKKKAEKATKITNEELNQVQSVINDINRAQLEVGSMESKKHNLLHHVSMLQEQLNKMQVDFEKTYGTADINIQDGTINHKEDVKTD